jgi:DNA-binding transcriptional MerR regulator
MRDNLLSIGTVAELVGRSRVTLLNLERDGLIPPALRVEGRDWRLFRREDLPAIEAAIANRRGPGRPPRREADDGPEAA